MFVTRVITSILCQLIVRAVIQVVKLAVEDQYFSVLHAAIRNNHLGSLRTTNVSVKLDTIQPQVFKIVRINVLLTIMLIKSRGCVLSVMLFVKHVQVQLHKIALNAHPHQLPWRA